MRRWLSRLYNRLKALRLAYKALSTDYDPPAYPGAFRNSKGAYAWLIDARGMWHHA